jgi:hypothetical protein
VRAEIRPASCRCDRILPLCGSFWPEDPQCGSGDEVALQVEGVVNRGVHAEKALGRSSKWWRRRATWSGRLMVYSGMSSTWASGKISWPPRCAAAALTLASLDLGIFDLHRRHRPRRSPARGTLACIAPRRLLCALTATSLFNTAYVPFCVKPSGQAFVTLPRLRGSGALPLSNFLRETRRRSRTCSPSPPARHRAGF